MLVSSVRRVREYSSSFLDLKDYIRKDIGFTQRDDGPKEVKKHRTPLTPSARSTQSTGIFQRASDSIGAFSTRVFRGEGATANFTAILN